MNKYSDLELSILSCLLQKPELMENTKLKDEYFISHKKIWSFMKAFYKKFNNFDITLMTAISKNKYRMIEYIVWLIDVEPTLTMFKYYENELICEYKELKKDKYIRDKIYDLANDLLVRNIKTDEFMNKCKDIYKNAEKIF